jgi:hypothetical protein
VNCGANKRIGKTQVQYAEHVFSIGMRVFSAGFGAFFVNQACVVCTQKWAWSSNKNIVPILVPAQIGINKGARLHPKCLGKPIYIGLNQNGAGSFAAIGTSQTI